MKKLQLLFVAAILTTLSTKAQVTLKDKDGKEYKMDIVFDDPSVFPKYHIHVFQPSAVISEGAAFFAPNLGADFNANEKLKLTLDFAPAIGESNVSIKNLPTDLQSSAQQAFNLDLSGSYLLKSKITEKTKKVVIGGGGDVTIITKMPIHGMKGFALRGGFQGLNTTPDVSATFSDANNDLTSYTITNRKSSAITVGPSYVTRTAYQVVLDGRTFVGYSQNEFYVQFGAGIQNSVEMWEGNQGITYVKQSDDVANKFLKDPAGLAWKAGVRSMRYRPDAKLCKYFYLGIEFGSMPAASFDSDKAGFFRFAFGYAFGKDIAR